MLELRTHTCPSPEKLALLHERFQNHLLGLFQRHGMENLIYLQPLEREGGDRTLVPEKRPTPDRPRYWFPAKVYGRGWGLPSTWEGWGVLAGHLALPALCLRVFPPHRNLPGFIVSVHGLSGLLVAICWWKGEPPRWRRG